MFLFSILSTRQQLYLRRYRSLVNATTLARNREKKEIRPIPMPVPCIFQERIPLYQMQPIKHERVQGIIQHEEAREKVIPVFIIRVRRWIWGRCSDIYKECYQILYTICSNLSTWLPSLDNSVSLSY